MAGPFYARYEVEFGQGEEHLDDIVDWYRLLEKRTRDTQTGLLYHGWDESGVQLWADSDTGRSSHFWSRAMGLSNVCRSAGLGGGPYRDGSYEYYVTTDKVVNDAHGVGSFILAAVEMGE